MTEHRDRSAVPLPPLGTRLGRAARLRCPLCGGRGVLESWFRMRARCPHCGLHTERGEHDFFLGSMMFNLVLSEGLLALLLVGLAIVTWPNVPWDFLQYGGVALMVLAPIAFLPFSRTIWMAFDLLLHPPTRDELDPTVAEKEPERRTGT